MAMILPTAFEWVSVEVHDWLNVDYRSPVYRTYVSIMAMCWQRMLRTKDSEEQELFSEEMAMSYWSR